MQINNDLDHYIQNTQKQFYQNQINNNKMKCLSYEADQTNINRMIQIQRQRINHIKMLNTIYKKKSYSLIKNSKGVDKQRDLRQKNQIIDKQRKWRQTQSIINRQNGLLRNKLISIYVPRQKQQYETFKREQTSKINRLNESTFGLNFRSISQSTKKYSFSKSNTSTSNLRMTQKSLNESNSRFFQKLTNIKSDLMPILSLQKHNQKVSYLKEMVKKKSPEKLLRLQNIAQRRNLHQRSKQKQKHSQSFQQIPDLNVQNPEVPFIFY